MINPLNNLIKNRQHEEQIGNIIRNIEILRKHHKEILEIKNKEKRKNSLLDILVDLAWQRKESLSL